MSEPTGPIDDELLHRYVTGALEGEALVAIETQILRDDAAFEQVRLAQALRDGLVANAPPEIAAITAPPAGSGEIVALPKSRTLRDNRYLGSIAATMMVAFGLYTWVDLPDETAADHDRSLYLLTERSTGPTKKFEYTAEPPERFTLIVDLDPGMEDGVDITLTGPDQRATTFEDVAVDDYEAQIVVVLTATGSYHMKVEASHPPAGKPAEKDHVFEMRLKTEAPTPAAN